MSCRKRNGWVLGCKEGLELVDIGRDGRSSVTTTGNAVCETLCRASDSIFCGGDGLDKASNKASNKAESNCST